MSQQPFIESDRLQIKRPYTQPELILINLANQFFMQTGTTKPISPARSRFGMLDEDN